MELIAGRGRLQNTVTVSDFMNKQDEAIERLERARQIQQEVEPEPRHAQTFVALARMYQQKGEVKRARDVLLEGLSTHPDHEEIRRALEALDR